MDLRGSKNIRKAVIAGTIPFVLVLIGLGIFWKEHDHMWWDLYWAFLNIGGVPWNWIEAGSWQVGMYGSWCIFKTLQMVCMALAITIPLLVTLWCAWKPEPIYMPFTSELVAVSYNRGKSWTLEEFTLLKETTPKK